MEKRAHGSVVRIEVGRLWSSIAKASESGLLPVTLGVQYSLCHAYVSASRRVSTGSNMKTITSEGSLAKCVQKQAKADDVPCLLKALLYFAKIGLGKQGTRISLGVTQTRTTILQHSLEVA